MAFVTDLRIYSLLASLTVYSSAHSALALWTPEASARSASVPEMRAKLKTRNQIVTFIRVPGPNLVDSGPPTSSLGLAAIRWAVLHTRSREYVAFLAFFLVGHPSVLKRSFFLFLLALFTL